jgi:hypothetical protein
MCEPVSIGLGIASAAAGLGSSMMHSQAQGERSAARDRVTNAQTQRVQGYDNQSNQLFSNTLQQTSREGQDETRRGAETQRVNTANATLEGAADPTNPSDNTGDSTNVVKSENARQLIKALNFGKDRARRGAAVNAYGDSALKTGIGLGRAAQEQATIGGKMQRSVIPLQAEYEEANRAGSGADTWGSLLGVGSQLAGAGASYGVGGGLFSPTNGGAAVTGPSGITMQHMGGSGPGRVGSSMWGRMFGGRI